MIVTSEGIILNSKKYGDTSKIISVFTLEYGKISLIAKGARMSKNKFGSSLEPLSCSNLTFYLKPNTDLYLLSKSELSKKWFSIYGSAESLSAGFTILETVSVSQLIKHPNPELYVLLSECIENLNISENNPQSTVIWFFCRFAEIMGFELNFENISDDTNIIYQLAVDSGSLLMNYQPTSSRVFKIASELMIKFANINYSELSEIKNNNLTKTEIITLYNFFGTYFSYHFDTKFVLKTVNLL